MLYVDHLGSDIAARTSMKGRCSDTQADISMKASSAISSLDMWFLMRKQTAHHSEPGAS